MNIADELCCCVVLGSFTVSMCMQICMVAIVFVIVCLCAFMCMLLETLICFEINKVSIYIYLSIVYWLFERAFQEGLRSHYTGK